MKLQAAERGRQRAGRQAGWQGKGQRVRGKGRGEGALDGDPAGGMKNYLPAERGPRGAEWRGGGRRGWGRERGGKEEGTGGERKKRVGKGGEG